MAADPLLLERLGRPIPEAGMQGNPVPGTEGTGNCLSQKVGGFPGKRKRPK